MESSCFDRYVSPSSVIGSMTINKKDSAVLQRLGAHGRNVNFSTNLGIVSVSDRYLNSGFC